MGSKIDWVEIENVTGKPIGAIGFIGDDAVIVASFYESLDANKDGTVSIAERIVGKFIPGNSDEMAVAEVAIKAAQNPDITMRDPSFRREGSQIFTKFASGMAMDALWSVYFARGVKMAGAGVARVITRNQIKQIFIRKGFEKAAREAFNAAVGV